MSATARVYPEWEDIAFGLTVLAFSAALVRSWMGPDLTPRWVQMFDDIMRGSPQPCKRQQQHAPNRLVILRRNIWESTHDATVSMRMVYAGAVQTRMFRGSGFIVSTDGYIVTAAHNVIAAYPEGGLKNGKLVRATEVTVSVTNMNGNKGQHASLLARIVGTSGIADIAVLKVDGLSTHSYVSLESSSPATGTPCVVIGNPLGADPQSYAAGHVRDGQYFDPQGDQVVESVFTDVIAYPGNSGSPILNESGRCIGIYTFGSVNEIGMGGGVSMRIARPIIAAIIDADRQGKAAEHIDENGDYVSGFTGVRWVAYSDFEAAALGHPSTKLIGAVVDRFYDPKIFPDVRLNDVVTHIDGKAIGNLPGQIPPTNVTIYKLPGQQVELTIERSPDFTPFTITQTLGTIPGRYNYPLVNTASYVFRGPKRKAVVRLLERLKTL